MNPQISKLSIYIGDTTAHGSERTLLRFLSEYLKTMDQDAIIFSNINLRSRQLDFVVVLTNTVAVLEAKGFLHPVKGGTNGAWLLTSASTVQKKIRNPYLQTLEAALALKDSVSLFAGNAFDIPYPTAGLVFVPKLPLGSEVCGSDHKVSLIDLSGLPSLIQQSKVTNGIPLEKWHEFAQHLNLQRIENVESAFDQKLASDEVFLEQYSESFLRTYQQPYRYALPRKCSTGGTEKTSAEVISKLTTSRSSILLSGPSGCGKSHMAGDSGLQFTRSGGLVILIHCEDFQGKINSLLETEISLLVGVKEVGRLLSAAATLDKPVLIIADGYNQCKRHLQSKLTRALAALAHRIGSTLLVTSQGELEQSDLLALESVILMQPDLATKEAIALQKCDGPLDEQSMLLLSSVVTALEADLVGQMTKKYLSNNLSRFALFDAFARERLGTNATSGIKMLVTIARWLSKNISYSITVNEFERVCASDNLTSFPTSELLNAGIIIQRSNRLQFAHELFLDIFASEAIIRDSKGSADKIVLELESPINENRMNLIVGTIESDFLLRSVLETIKDANLVYDCLTGICGLRAKDWSRRFCQNLIVQIFSETARIQFDVHDQEPLFNGETLESWSSLSKAFLDAIPKMLLRGEYLKEVFDLVKLMDSRMAQELERLSRETDVSNHLRDQMFSLVYCSGVIWGTTAGVREICHGLTGLRGGRNAHEPLSEHLAATATAVDLTDGQFYLLLKLSDYVETVDFLLPKLERALSTEWNSMALHVQLTVLETCRRFRFHELSKTESLRALIQQLDLSELDQWEMEHEIAVRKRLSELLEMTPNDLSCSIAVGIFNSQFEHPYANAYANAINGLPTAERKQFLRFVLQGADQYSQTFLSFAVSELAELRDVESGPALLHCANSPVPDGLFFFDSMEAILEAYLGLAKINYPIPSRSATAEAVEEKALFAYAELLYWNSRDDLAEATQQIHRGRLLSLLLKLDPSVALESVRLCIHALSRYDRKDSPSILDHHSVEVVEICRKTLESPDEHWDVFNTWTPVNGKYKALEFALAIIAKYGDATDLLRLKSLSSHLQLGGKALEGVRALEHRLF